MLACLITAVVAFVAGAVLTALYLKTVEARVREAKQDAIKTVKTDLADADSEAKKLL